MQTRYRALVDIPELEMAKGDVRDFDHTDPEDRRRMRPHLPKLASSGIPAMENREMVAPEVKVERILFPEDDAPVKPVGETED